MIVNGKHYANISCARCGHRHPLQFSCQQAREYAEAAPGAEVEEPRGPLLVAEDGKLEITIGYLSIRMPLEDWYEAGRIYLEERQRRFYS